MAVRTYTSAQMGARISEHFTVADVWADPSLSAIKHDDRLTDVLEAFYTHFGLKPRLRNAYVNGDIATRYKPVASAGYRAKLSTSQHHYGRALDIEIPGIPAYKLAQYAETLPQVHGIGHYYHTSEAIDRMEHIHIDVRSRSGVARWGHQGRTSRCNIPTFGGVYAVIRRGHKGVAVRLIQQALNTQGYACGAVDGDFGVKTDAALRRYQSDHHLAVDGKYGRKTDTAMGLFSW